jgi:hypothetical protein
LADQFFYSADIFTDTNNCEFHGNKMPILLAR